MENVDLIINARWCLPMTADQLVLENHSIVVNDGLIVALLPQPEAERLYQASQTHNLENIA